MSYASIESFKKRLSSEHEFLFFKNEIMDDTVLQQYLDDASNLLDSYAGGFTPASPPASYEAFCCDLAIYLAMNTSSSYDELYKDRHDQIFKAVATMKNSGNLAPQVETTQAEKTVGAWDEGLPPRFNNRY